MNKLKNRIRRAQKTRAKITNLNSIRLCIHKSNNHIYAQIISEDGARILAQASTLEKDFRNGGYPGNTVQAANQIGQLIAERAKNHGIKRLAFDRSGFKYHGRVKALADAARENGLEF